MKKTITLLLLLSLTAYASDPSIHITHTNKTINEPMTYTIELNCTSPKLSGRTYEIRAEINNQTQLQDWFIHTPGKGKTYTLEYTPQTENATLTACTREKGRIHWTCTEEQKELKTQAEETINNLQEIPPVLFAAAVCAGLVLTALLTFIKRKYMIGITMMIATIAVSAVTIMFL